MNILKPTTLTWYQLGALKWAVLLIGMAVGASWPELFAKYVLHLVAIGAVLSLYLIVVWLKQR
jgi:nitrogen fixation/metabolism regulation signal transduction histidine kinase